MMDDGTEGESVAERRGQVGDLYARITGGHLLGPLEQHLLIAAARLPLHRLLRRLQRHDCLLACARR